MTENVVTDRQTDTQTHRPSTVTLAAHARRGIIIGERERANLYSRTTGAIFLYIYGRCTYRNVLRISKSANLCTEPRADLEKFVSS